MFSLFKSKETKAIERLLESSSSEIIEHIIHLYLNPGEDEEYRKSCIWSLLHALPTRKHSGIFPKEQFIFNHTWKVAGKRPSLLVDVMYAASPEHVLLTLDEILSIEKGCKLYFKWLSKMLSSQGSVTKLGVNDMLDFITKGDN